MNAEAHKPMRFFCITQPWLEATNSVLAAACEARGINMVMVSPSQFSYTPSEFPQPGDLLYCAATEVATDRLEKLLWQPGVAAFYDDPLFECLFPGILFQKNGIPMPRTVHAPTCERATLETHVNLLGGFPVIVKIPGSEGGKGVIRVDSYAALFSLLDYVGTSPILMEYFEHVVSYRLIVIGDHVVACEARHAGPGDFRTNSTGSDSIGAVAAPPAAIEMALKAAQVLRVEFGGIDILENQDQKLLLAELNFPCYFADQQRDSGIDIAGAMLDHLIEKSRRLNQHTALI